LPEERNPTLDARQVLEVGREADEEHVDTLLPHDLGEPPTPFRVVEHAVDPTEAARATMSP